MTSETVSLSKKEAIRIVLAAQGLAGARLKSVPALLKQVRAVQLDTISVLARSHEIGAYARLGPVGRGAIETAYWGNGSETFEYWSHAACLLPLEDWPAYRFRRERARRERGTHGDPAVAAALVDVRRKLDESGPQTARQLGGAKNGGAWWDWSATKHAAEILLAWGDVVCRTRIGFQRVYSLTDRAVPESVRTAELTDGECCRYLVASAIGALGIATVSDIASYHTLPRSRVTIALEELPVVSVAVEGWGAPAFALESELRPVSRLRAPTLLSPFDSLIWERDRCERLFGVRYRLEAYLPPHKRVYGYFAMPVLDGDRIVALVDPGRSGSTLIAKRTTLLAPHAERAVARALANAASWVSCSSVEIGDVKPAISRNELRVLTAAGAS